jgi:hypothetical protein
MSVLEIRSRVTRKSLMRKSKSELVHDYIRLLDMIQPANDKASEARRKLVESNDGTTLTATAELGLLRAWYDGSKHLVGTDA